MRIHLSMARRKRLAAPRTALDSFKGRVRSSSNHLAVVAKERGTLAPDEFPEAIKWLKTIPGANHVLTHSHHSWETLQTAPTLPSVGFGKELAWAAALLVQRADCINDYLQLVAHYDDLLLRAQYQRCVSVLDELDAKCGVSLFSLEQRIALLHMAKGLKVQRAFAGEIIQFRPQSDIVSFIARQISERNEEQTTTSRFIARLESYNWSGVHDDVVQYVFYRVGGRIPNDLGALDSIFRIEAASSIIDLYTTFLDVVLHLVANQSDQVGALWHQVDRVHRVIHDGRLSRALFTHKPPSEGISLADDSKPWLTLIAGQYATARSLASSDHRSGYVASFWYIESVAAIELGETSVSPRTLRSRIVAALIAVFSRNSDYLDSVAELNKVILNNRLCAFAPELKSILSPELSSDPIADSRLLQTAFFHSCRPGLYSFAVANINRPCLQTVYNDAPPDKRLVIDFAAATAGQLKPLASLASLASVASTESFNSAQGNMQYALRDFIEASQSAAVLMNSRSVRFQRIGVRLRCAALLELGEYAELIQQIVTWGLRDPASIPMLPLLQAAYILKDKEVRRPMASLLATPILLDLYSRYIADDLDHIRAFAYDQFLIAQGFRRPHELATSLDRLDRTELVYFLRQLCVPANMERSLALESTRDVENERIAVCALLSEIDSINTASYESEISTIAKLQTVREAVRHTELSKIYVDINGLKRWAERELGETYSRFRLLEQLTPSVRIKQVLHAIEDLLAERRQKGVLFVQFPDDESVAVFFEVVDEIFRAATFSADYGLDYFLSGRIRHGTLAALLRSGFETQHLITQKVSEGDYVRNEYWASAFDAHWSSQQLVLDKLRDFATAFDGLVDRLKNDLIQIKSAEKPRGLFNLSATASDRSALFELTTDKTTLSELVDLCMELFWKKVEDSLNVVRHTIDSEIKPTVTELATSLERSVNEITAAASHPDFSRAVWTAQTETLRNLDRIKGWFQLPREEEEPVLSLDQLVEASVSTVRAVHRDFNPQIRKDKLPEVRYARALNRFSYILWIILENIWKHSHANSSPWVVVSASVDKDLLFMRVENQIGEGACNDESRRQLDHIRQRLAEAKYESALRTEGGTGIIKLARLIDYTLADSKLEFGFINGAAFYIEFSVDTSSHRVDDD